MFPESHRTPSQATPSRRGRKETRRFAALRRAGRRGSAVVWAVAGLLTPQALATPQRSDEVALLVVVVWAGIGFLATRRRSTAGVASVIGVVAVMAGGLGVYWLGSLLPPASSVGVSGWATATERPCVLVTSENSQVVLGRVVAVNPDLSLVIDAGEGFGEVSGPAARGEIVFLSGIDPQNRPPPVVEAARRWLKAETLGRLVTLRVVPGAPERREAFVFAGVKDPAAASGDSSVNAGVSPLLDPPPALPPAPADPGP